MSATLDKIVSHVKENTHIYRDPRNIVTLTLWGLALASHAILLPLLVRELYEEIVRQR